MLHLPSYNAGLAAGTVAKALGHDAPTTWDEVPGFEEIVNVRAKDRFFFPLSFAEGYWAAFEYPERPFSALPSDPKPARWASGDHGPVIVESTPEQVDKNCSTTP